MTRHPWTMIIVLTTILTFTLTYGVWELVTDWIPEFNSTAKLRAGLGPLLVQLSFLTLYSAGIYFLFKSTYTED